MAGGRFYGLIELLLVFGAILVWAGWQWWGWWTWRRQQRREADRDDPPA